MMKNWVVFSLFFCLWFGFLFLTGTLYSGFHFTDDHDVIRIKADFAYSSIEREARLLTREITSPHLRFRPFYMFHRRAAAAILGTDFFAWSVYFGFLAVFTSFFLFLVMRKTGFSILESFFFPGFVLLGEQAAIWWKLGANEILGMFMLSVTLLWMVKSAQAPTTGKRLYSNILWIIFAVLMSWSKESFILMIPALIVWKWWLTDRKARAIFPSVILAGVFALELLHVMRNVGTAGIRYAGYEGFRLSPFISTFFRSFIVSGGWVIIVLAVILIYLRLKKKGDSLEEGEKKPDLLWGTVISGLIIMPQVLLYTKSGIMERYLLPAVVGYGLLAVVLLREIWKKRNTFETGGKKWFLKLSWFQIAALGAMIVVLALNSRVTRYSAIGFAHKGRDVRAWFDSIQRNTKLEDLIMVVIHPVRNIEEACSIQAYLDLEMQRPNNLFVTSDLRIKEKKDKFWGPLNRRFLSQNRDFSLKDESSLKRIRAILLFPGMEEKFLPFSKSVFKLDDFERYSNEGGYVGYYRKSTREK